MTEPEPPPSHDQAAGCLGFVSLLAALFFLIAAGMILLSGLAVLSVPVAVIGLAFLGVAVNLFVNKSKG